MVGIEKIGYEYLFDVFFNGVYYFIILIGMNRKEDIEKFKNFL